MIEITRAGGLRDLAADALLRLPANEGEKAAANSRRKLALVIVESDFNADCRIKHARQPVASATTGYWLAGDRAIMKDFIIKALLPPGNSVMC